MSSTHSQLLDAMVQKSKKQTDFSFEKLMSQSPPLKQVCVPFPNSWALFRTNFYLPDPGSRKRI